MKDYTDAELAQILDKDIFHMISEAADSLGLECYVVGGYVRDIFLEKPSDDIDCVVVAPNGMPSPGIAVAKCLKKKLGKKASLSVFKNFGTAQVKVYGGPLPPPSPVEREPLSPSGGPSTDSSELPSLEHSGSLPTGEGGGRGREDVESLEIEFVGARKESYQRDSRKPIVEDGTLEDDQNRRDFTINAMAICLNKSRFGELVDPFGGIDDLYDGIIRTPLDPDITFSDDPLRMLRCIRFATRFNFLIEDETFEALERNAERIKIISGERIAEELNKTLMTKHPSRGFVDLQRSGLLAIIFPELSQMDMVETKNGRAHKNNFYHTLEVLENLISQTTNTQPASTDTSETSVGSPASSLREREGGEASLWLRWSAVLHDIGKPKSKRWDPVQGWTFHAHNIIGAKMIPGIFRRMKLPMDAKMKFVQKMVELHMRPIAIADDIVTDSAVRRLVNDAGDDIDALMALCEADITSKNQQRKQKFLDNYQLVRQKIEDLKEKDFKRLLQPVIDGNEIMEMYNLKPSREVGILKQYLKDAVLDNKVENEREPLLALLNEKAKELGLV